MKQEWWLRTGGYKQKKKNQLEILEMKRSHSEIKDDVTISLKYPRLRKWTRELAFQSGEIACTDDRKYQIRCLAGIKQASTGKLYYVFNISL